MMPAIDRSQWGIQQAAHLLNRAGFGCTPAEAVEAAAKDPAEVVDALVDYDAIPDDKRVPTWMNSDASLRLDRRELQSLSEEERREKMEERRKLEVERLIELRAWWLYRMRHTQRPLQEKLTLFWHGHFATSFEKVRASYVLLLQNEMFRHHANGNWRKLLGDLARDPAMLIYLDNAMSKADHPNENFARELMELFTLGEGHYTEKDVKEAARAFTGWSLDEERFEFRRRPRIHDDGEKTFLGMTGDLDGDEILDAIVAHEQCSRFICRKLWSFFAYANPPDEIVESLAATHRAGKYEFKPVLKEMFLSRAFYGKKAVATQIKSPVQWLVGLCRKLEAPLPGPLVSALMMRSLGQELFAPPNVKGWDGGYTWITTATLMQRYNYAAVMVQGGEAALEDLGPRIGAMLRVDGPGEIVRKAVNQMALLKPLPDPERILPRDKRAHHAMAISEIENRLFNMPLPASQRAALDRYAGTLPQPRSWTDAQVLEMVQLLTATPQFQLT